jgi:hypothetical protein
VAMDTFVCKYSSKRHIKVIKHPPEWKGVVDYIEMLYKEMFRELKIGDRTGGHDEYYTKRIMDSENREKFEHHIEAACISNFKNPFDFLYGSNKTIEAEKHLARLITVGKFPYVHWEVTVESESYLYTVRERLPSATHWEKLKAEKGNTLISAYQENTIVKYQTLSFDPNLVEVRIVR